MTMNYIGTPKALALLGRNFPLTSANWNGGGGGGGGEGVNAKEVVDRMRQQTFPIYDIA